MTDVGFLQREKNVKTNMKSFKIAEFYAEVNNVKPNQWKKWAVYAFWQLRSQEKSVFFRNRTVMDNSSKNHKNSHWYLGDTDLGPVIELGLGGDDFLDVRTAEPVRGGVFQI
jgi:hypothetical protein